MKPSAGPRCCVQRSTAASRRHDANPRPLSPTLRCLLATHEPRGGHRETWAASGHRSAQVGRCTGGKADRNAKKRCCGKEREDRCSPSPPRRSRSAADPPAGGRGATAGCSLSRSERRTPVHIPPKMDGAVPRIGRTCSRFVDLRTAFNQGGMHRVPEVGKPSGEDGAVTAWVRPATRRFAKSTDPGFTCWFWRN